jgi:diguanylate cyclase (GGDEF)-like protein
MARSTSVLFGAASLITGLGLVLPHDRRVDAKGLVAVAVVAGVVSVVLAWRKERMPALGYTLVALLGTGLVSLSLFFNGERHGGPTGSDEIFYLWVTLWAAYYFTRRLLALQVAVILSAYGVTLALIHPGSAGTSRFVSVAGLVIGAAVVVRMLAERNTRLVAELRIAALTDPLTGLANRRGLEQALGRAGARAARTNRPFGLLVIDLDQFKRLNDEFGHKAGDRALVEVAHLLDAHARPDDTAARTGGDEFAILLPDTDARGTEVVRARLAQAIAEHTHEPEWPSGASIGSAVSDVDGAGMDALMRHADMRLYAAKRARQEREPAGDRPLRRAS